MEQYKQPDNAPELMLCPAFSVVNGKITQVNNAALKYGIQADMQIESLIHTGVSEFSEFTEGRLDLTLTVSDRLINACVTPAENGYIFCLESDFAQPEQRALALAAQHLRAPLSDAIANTENLADTVASSEKMQVSQIRRNLQQIMRMLSNMSDIANYSSTSNLCNCNIVAVFSEVLEKAKTLLDHTGKKLQFHLPQQAIICNADEKMLERAILNLISNAAKFSEGSEIIKAELTSNGHRLYFCVENACSNTADKGYSLFSRYMREPAIEEGRSGIGLGLPIVRAVAAAHNGTLLMDQPTDGGIRFTMTISTHTTATTSLRSHIRIPVDYSGGWDHALMELSEILPPELYK